MTASKTIATINERIRTEEKRRQSLQSELAKAQAELRERIGEGRNPGEARARIASLKTDIAASEKSLAGLRAEMDKAKHGAIAQIAGPLRQQATQAIKDAQAGLSPIPQQPQKAMMTTNPEIDRLADAVARARFDLDQAMQRNATAKEKLTALQQRISDTEAQRAAITRRRLAGEAKDADAAEYAALAGDLEVLRDLAGEAQALVMDADTAKPQSQLAHAKAELEAAEKQAALDAIVSHAREIETLLVQTLQDAWNVARSTGRPRTPGDVFTLSPVLQNLVRYNSFYGLG